jgi:hypothetical protein
MPDSGRLDLFERFLANGCQDFQLLGRVQR